MRRAVPWSSIALAFVALALALAAIELMLSFRIPFVRNAFPTVFDPRVGRIFRPHAEVRWTNYLDFAVVDNANSLGFADREPPTAKTPGVYRILFLGDSFVEAVQVPTDEKVHVRLESMLAQRFPGHRFETMALARSGVGTATELAFYEAFGRQLDPNLVVLVFVDNDFADNSPLLMSLNYGWDPEHPAWPMVAEDDAHPGTFRRIAPDPDYDRHGLGIGPPRPAALTWREYLGWSRLAQFTFAVADSQQQWIGGHQNDLEKARLDYLRRDPRLDRKLAGWRYPDDLSHNQMFFAKDLPPAWQEAVRITEHVFELFAEEQRRRGFEMLVVALPTCSLGPTTNRYREVIDRGMLMRLQAIAAEYGFPVLDLAPSFAAHGDAAAVRWKHDVHWTPAGHRWAAEAIADYIAANRDRLFMKH